MFYWDTHMENDMLSLGKQQGQLQALAPLSGIDRHIALARDAGCGDNARSRVTAQTNRPVADADALLVRAIGTRQLAAGIFNYIVGVGIFGLPAIVFPQIGFAARSRTSRARRSWDSSCSCSPPPIAA